MHDKRWQEGEFGEDSHPWLLNGRGPRRRRGRDEVGTLFLRNLSKLTFLPALYFTKKRQN